MTRFRIPRLFGRSVLAANYGHAAAERACRALDEGYVAGYGENGMLTYGWPIPVLTLDGEEPVISRFDEQGVVLVQLPTGLPALLRTVDKDEAKAYFREYGRSLDCQWN